VFETQKAVAAGTTEIDMVINLGDMRAVAAIGSH
jgi:deoxyribose-phosphate aldolase